MPPDQLGEIDDWRRKQTDHPTRPEAVRRLAAKSLNKRPKAPPHRWEGSPELLLFGIQSIGDVWHKMVWDISQFEKILLEKPVDIVAVPLAYPNVCVSAVALRDWFVDETRRRAKAAKRKWSDDDAFAIVRTRIRWSQLAEDVANTFKHRNYRSSGFQDGLVDISVFFPAGLQAQFEKLSGFDGSLFALRHQDVASWTVKFRDVATGEEIDAISLFSAWELDWHKLLSEMQMLED